MLLGSLATPHAGARAGFDFPNVRNLASAAPETRALVALLKTHKPIAYKAKDVLFHEGDVADSVFLVASGMICLYRFMPNGQRMIARFIFPHEVVGLSFVTDCDFTAACVEPTTVYKIARSSLTPLCAHSPVLQNDVVLMLKHELRLEQEDHLPIMHLNAEARVARLLRIVARHTGADCRKGERIQLAMTRADIADFLGLTIETVCRTFSRMKEEGLISAPSPDRIRIENVDAFISLADGEE
jgi:CRP/FNR family transcriptional regulator